MSHAEETTMSIDRTAKLLGVGRKRVTAYIRAGTLRILGGNPTRRQRMPMNAQVLVSSIREALELPEGAPLPGKIIPFAPLPGDRELGEPVKITGTVNLRRTEK